MEPLKVTLIISAILALSLFVCWLDYKKGWQLAAWFSGKVDNPFVKFESQTHSDASTNKQSPADKDRIIAELTERVQTLEKIVTEPAYELNQKLNRL